MVVICPLGVDNSTFGGNGSLEGVEEPLLGADELLLGVEDRFLGARESLLEENNSPAPVGDKLHGAEHSLPGKTLFLG